MDRKLIVVLKWSFILNDDISYKQLMQKNRLVLGKKIGFIDTNTSITVRMRNACSSILMDDTAKIYSIGDYYCLKTKTVDSLLLVMKLKATEYLLLVVEGSTQNARIVVFPIDHIFFATLETEEPTLRLSSYDLPPADFELIDSAHVLNVVYVLLSKHDPELFSERSKRFLQDPHILTQMFSHVMSLNSSDHINYISHLRIISDNLREMLLPRIVGIERNHKTIWPDYKGRNITYADGGMSRIVSLPGTEPMGIRVGCYTVTPGKQEEGKSRESWRLYSYVIGDVLNDYGSIEAENYQTDPKRLREAARYILEPLTILRHLNAEKEKTSDLVFLHGPLQNAFETYDELTPYYVPGAGKGFLDECAITRADIEASVSSIPNNFRADSMWNQCIPVYLWIMKKIFSCSIPIVGVVERTNSQEFTKQILIELVKDGTIPDSTMRKIRSLITKYDIGDEFLFGCVLEEGEYIRPVSLIKNLRKRAHDKWQPVVEQFPKPFSTMLKTSANRFPFRVEINGSFDESIIKKIMNLLYHTSLLLPHYAFPVGIDIADKYARIPDWLSKGISATLTAAILSKTLQTGNDRLLRQVRQLLARSPRDFFFRPGV